MTSTFQGDKLLQWETRAHGSALWAAYGDALGFISELANQKLLEQRLGAAEVRCTTGWTRRIGGKFGINVQLPAGSYSDDTQQRLAVGRAIAQDGSFDAEAFARLELPVWLCYKLGSGTASKLAAENLAKRGVSWSTNFYNSQAMYTKAGGNGAAMRIQPHVWALPESASEMDLLSAIIRNAIITHGHPRAILGAAFHGLCLYRAMSEGKIPSPTSWQDSLGVLKAVPDLLKQDQDLNYLWLPNWERETGQSFGKMCSETIKEMASDIQTIERFASGKSREDYKSAAFSIGAFNRESRGSGTKTVLLASLLALMAEGQPEKGTLWSANTLGTDTDTIGTMAGALIGSISAAVPGHPLQDVDYISSEARRLAKLRFGHATLHFAYPDLISWTPPANQSDVLFMTNGSVVVSGLGPATLEGDPVWTQNQGWQWARLSFEQTLLVKRRKEIEQRDTVYGAYTTATEQFQERRVTPKPVDPVPPPHSQSDRRLLVDDACNEVIRSGFDPMTIGNLLLELTAQEEGVDKAIAFAAIVSKARKARQLKDARESSPASKPPE